MLYELVLRGEFLGEQTINRFHYNQSGTPAAVSGSFALVSALGFIQDGGITPAGTLFAAISNMLSTSQTFVEVTCKALYDVEDFYVLPYIPPLAGGATGEASPTFVAYGFTSNRVRTDIRRGQKRFAGCSETYLAPGGVLTGAGITAALPLADALGETVTYDDEGNTITFNPVVLSFEKYAPSVGKVAYRPYATLAAQLTHMAAGITWNYRPTVTSQNSRKVGRGA